MRRLAVGLVAERTEMRSPVVAAAADKHPVRHSAVRRSLAATATEIANGNGPGMPWTALDVVIVVLVVVLVVAVVVVVVVVVVVSSNSSIG